MKAGRIGALRVAALTIASALFVFGLRGMERRSLAEARRSEGLAPHPVMLRRPASGPLSAMARLGKSLFFDAHLSASGRLSCASCHDPANAYGPPPGASVMFGGAHLSRQGVRAVPSLMYLEREPPFSVGPDNAENETTTLAQSVVQARGSTRARKTAAQPMRAAGNLVPQGGLFWDGRANTLQQQAHIPLTNPIEMDAGSDQKIAAKLASGGLAPRFKALFGAAIFNNAELAVSEAMFALARFQIEDESFHPYSSKFDAWLEGRARLAPRELRGYQIFNDPDKGNCAACHLDRPTPDLRPPLFTDHQFEALGVPRNTSLGANRDPAYFDLGLCGPYRTDLSTQKRYCGMFLTPTLRNVATRHVFFHNGVYASLKQVLDFYDFRDVDPARIYPLDARGAPEKFNDLPLADWTNVDRADAPFNRKLGAPPPLSKRDEADIIAFLSTLTDGYKPR